MADAWSTDGGMLPFVMWPEFNYELGGNEVRRTLELQESNNETPTPIQKLATWQQGEQHLMAIFKCYPYPPHNPEHEYQVEIWVTADRIDYQGDNICNIIYDTEIKLRDITTTNVEMTASQSCGVGTTVYFPGRAITGIFFWCYAGDEDILSGDEVLYAGIWADYRNLSDGTYVRISGSTIRGDGPGFSREYMRNTYGVDIHPTPLEPDPDVDDPNEDDDGYSGPGGGDGDHDHNSDDIGIPSLPTYSATATGFVTMYKANLAQMQAVAAELWTSTIWDALKGLFTDPLEYIVSVDISPVIPELSQGLYYPVVGNFMGVDVKLSTAMNIVTNQYVEVDCGTINLSKYYGSALDFSPYEKVQLHLPYVGVKDLDIDEVMGHDIGVKYHCDVMSGACVAFVTINGDNIAQTVRYEFTGNIISHIPISARSFDEVIKSVATLGATAAISAISAGAASGGQIADREGGAQVQGSEAAGTMTVKPNIQRAGALSTQLGYLGVQKPYITRTIPRQSLPENYSTYEGYPSNITENLGSLSGFTKVYSIRPNGFTCTAEELDELITLLKGGVIL